MGGCRQVPFVAIIHDEGWLFCCMLPVPGDRGGDGLSKVIMPGLAGYPELETEDGPGVVETRDWVLLDEILVVSRIKKKSITK